MLFGRKSWSRSLPSLGAHTASSAASAARATPRPSTPSPAFLSHCLRSKLIDPPSLSFIGPPSYPRPRRGRERRPTQGAALSAGVAGHDLVHPAREGYRVVELPEPHVPAEHHAGGPGFHVEPYLVDHALVAVVLLAAREED